MGKFSGVFDDLEPDSSKQFYDDTALGEIGEGIVSGAIGIGEGVLGLGAMAVDVVADTNYGDQVTQRAEALRDALGVDPEGFLGKGAEIVTQFVVPGLGAAAKVNSLAKAARAAKAAKAGPWAKAPGPMTKAERFSLAAKELAAAGAVDAVVSTDNTTTLGDWVEAGPTQTEDLIGLSGREKALARLGNRLKMGVESTALGGLVQGALVGGGRTLGQTRVAKNIAGAANRKIDEIGQGIDNLLIRRMTARPGSAEEPGAFMGRVADFLAASRYRGFLPEQVATRRLLMDGKVQSQIKRANLLLGKLDTEIDKSIKAFPTGPGGNLDRVGIMNRIESYLTESDRVVKARVLKELPKNIRQNAIRMRKHVDELSQGVLNSNFLKQNNLVTRDGQNLNDLIEQNLNSYLRRRYRVFEDAKYTPTQDSIKVANDFFRSNRKAVERELTTLARKTPQDVTDDFLLRNGLNRVGTGTDMRIELGAKVTDETVDLARDAFLSRYSIKNRGKMLGGRVARDRLDTGMFATREAVPKPLRQLLGEVDDPREAYLGTIADLAQFNAIDDYFGTITKLSESNSGIGKLFVNGNNLTPDQAKGLQERGFVKLGGDDGKSSMVGAVGVVPDDIDKMVGRAGWGSLDGYYVPAPIYNNLTNAVLAEDSIGAAITNATIGTFLKAKGISQYTTVVLSPITQVKNFTTALAFAMANGNIPIIGRGGSLIDSAQAIFANVRNKGADGILKDLLDAQRRGVVGTNAKLREIQDQLNKGLGLTAREPQNFAEAVAGKTGAVGTMVVGGLGKVTKPFEVFYQAGDDFWKYFNYNAEQAQIRHALRGADDATKIKYLTRNGTDVSPEVAEAIRKGDVDIDDLIKDRAAQIVRDTVPNYSKGASDLVRFGRKLPVGNFITFPAEMFRTGFNIVKQGLDDMASEVPGVQARGQQRLLGFGFTTAVVPAAISETAHQISGVSREEMDAYQRSFAAPWEKGSILVPVERTEDGKIKYINLSNSNPYDILSRFANRAINEAENAAAEGKDPGQALASVMVGTLTELFSPFLSEAMLTEALVDISLRDGRTSTGAEVYNPQDSFGDKGFKMLKHVFETIIPGFVPVNVSGGEFEPSRFARGVIGSLSPDLVDPEDKLGRERELTTEIFRQFTGITPMEFDPKKGLEFNAFQMQQAQTDAKRMFNRVTDDANATSETFLNAYVEANQAKLRVDRAYYRMIKDLQTMGLPEDEIRQILKKNNIGGFGALMRGMFEPFTISERNYQEMQDAGTIDRFPQSEILDLRNSLLEVPLESVPDIEAPSVEAPATGGKFKGVFDDLEAPATGGKFKGVFDDLEAPSGGGSGSRSTQGAAPPPPAFGSMPAPSAPQIPTAPANRASLSPSLLGGDLASQMANMEIAQRLGG
jgi:hypothetical protein